MEPPKFKTGDEVRLRTGKSKIIVVEVDYYDGNSRLRNYHKKGWGSENYKERYLAKAGWFIRFSYQSSLHYDNSSLDRTYRKWREIEDFVFYHPQTEKELPMTKPTLYQTNETPVRYGTLLTKNSVGQMVLEMKGEGGKCERFDEADIEVVTPFTVELTQMNTEPQIKSNSCHVIAVEGQVTKDDVLFEISTGRIWRVTVVDSKCLSPRENKCKWMKIPAEFITLGEK
jgi:uncharacterized protein YodC (DUF2158 family)